MLTSLAGAWLRHHRHISGFAGRGWVHAGSSGVRLPVLVRPCKHTLRFQVVAPPDARRYMVDGQIHLAG